VADKITNSTEVKVLDEGSQILVNPVDELSAITSNPEWRQKYIENSAKEESDVLSIFNRGISSEAKRMVGPRIREIVGPGASKEDYQTRAPQIFAKEEAGLREERKEEYLRLTNNLEAVKAGYQKSLEKFDDELAARRDDSNLKAAFVMWGRSPNHAGDRGVNGHGYNAGVIHYFEYRAFPDKNTHSPGEMSVDGFIAWSKHLNELVNGQKPEEVQKNVRLEDSSGKQALYLLTKPEIGRYMIISYVEKGETPRIVTAIPGQNEEVMSNRFESEIKTPVLEKQAKRLNYLGDGVHELT